MRPGLLLAFPLMAALAGAQPMLRVAGGITLNGAPQPLLFTWNSPITVSGGGWAPGETVRLFLHGPLDSLDVGPRRSRVVPLQRGQTAAALLVTGVNPRGPLGSATRPQADIPLGIVTAGAQGSLSAVPRIPFDSGIVGLQARIPRPGYYELRAAGSVSGTAAASDRINLCPDTYPGGGTPFDWGHDRGGRDGVFPGEFRRYSPERFDPEWPSLWDERPVEIYGTVAPTGDNGSDQPSRISPSDNPPTHYAHDAIIYVAPDPAYRWLVGTANYYDGDPDSPGRGTIEIEWEALNAGSTATYGQGNIGLPNWAIPSVGDRVYVVGRWILDAGHPETGDRTEVHPPRLVATMRRRPGISHGSAAAEVDIYVSGHGGGVNWMPPGLSGILDQSGYGGGRIRDVLNASAADRYYQAGPLAPLLYPLLVQLVRQLTGVSFSAPVFAEAGPSAFPWGGPGPEERPVNDRDYDFDVPLPPAPAGASTVSLEVVPRPGHTTAVNEEVTYAGSVAHVRLPYRGADSGIYARTLRFSWNQVPAPAAHFSVVLNRIDVTDSPGKWQLWADISGRWSYLSGMAPGLLNTAAGRSVTLPAQPTDVYLNPGQSLRVYVNGYRAECLDDHFGKLFGQSPYVAGLTFVAACGASDNQDLGGALLELPASPSPRGTRVVAATDAAGAHHFSVTLTID